MTDAEFELLFGWMRRNPTWGREYAAILALKEQSLGSPSAVCKTVGLQEGKLPSGALPRPGTRNEHRYLRFRQLVKTNMLRAQALVWESGGSRRAFDKLIDNLPDEPSPTPSQEHRLEGEAAPESSAGSSSSPQLAQSDEGHDVPGHRDLDGQQLHSPPARAT
jgi:hypothetical protein